MVVSRHNTDLKSIYLRWYKIKDQSYFSANVTERALAKVMMHKTTQPMLRRTQVLTSGRKHFFTEETYSVCEGLNCL